MVQFQEKDMEVFKPSKPGVRAPSISTALQPRLFEIQMISNAEPNLRHDMGSATSEINEVLSTSRKPIEELVRGGGGESVSQRVWD